MKPKSLSGLIFLVDDLEESKAFYQIIGFDFKKENPGISATGYMNWFWVELLLKSKVVTEPFKPDVTAQTKGAGLYAHLSVDGIDAYHNYLIENGLSPNSEPQDFPWGHREFTVRDPNGYLLVFFEKK